MRIRIACAAVMGLLVLAPESAVADRAQQDVFDARAERSTGFGISSTLSGQPALVVQEWRSPRAGYQYSLGGRYERVALEQSGATVTNDVLQVDLSGYFQLGVAGWSRSGLNVLIGFDLALVSVDAASADRINSLELWGVAGLRYEHYIAPHVSVHGQAGLGVGYRGEASLLRDGVVTPGADSVDQLVAFLGPATVAGSLGVTWWAL